MTGFSRAATTDYFVVVVVAGSFSFLSATISKIVVGITVFEVPLTKVAEGSYNSRPQRLDLSCLGFKFIVFNHRSSVLGRHFQKLPLVS